MEAGADEGEGVMEVGSGAGVMEAGPDQGAGVMDEGATMLWDSNWFRYQNIGSIAFF